MMVEEPKSGVQASAFDVAVGKPLKGLGVDSGEHFSGEKGLMGRGGRSAKSPPRTDGCLCGLRF